MRHRELDAVALAERLGAVETAFRAGAASLQRGIERDSMYSVVIAGLDPAIHPLKRNVG
jgi:hypothetical protein